MEQDLRATGESPARSPTLANDIDACGRRYLLGGIVLMVFSTSGENLVHFGRASGNAFGVVYLLEGFAQKVLLHNLVVQVVIELSTGHIEVGTACFAMLGNDELCGVCVVRSLYAVSSFSFFCKGFCRFSFN